MKRILVVEDNEANLYLTRFLLEKSGYEVVAAVDGKTAVTMAFDSFPDLIIMDVQLPDMDGLETTKLIRSKASKVPIIALTSYAMPGDREDALAAGCDGYIQKPVNPDTFIAEIEIYL